MWNHLFIQGNANVGKSHICQFVANLLIKDHYQIIDNIIIPNNNVSKIDDYVELLDKDDRLVLVNTASDDRNCYDILDDFINIKHNLKRRNLTVISTQRTDSRFSMFNDYETLLDTKHSSFCTRLFISHSIPSITPNIPLNIYCVGMANTAFNILKHDPYNL